MLGDIAKRYVRCGPVCKLMCGSGNIHKFAYNIFNKSKTDMGIGLNGIKSGKHTNRKIKTEIGVNLSS